MKTVLSTVLAFLFTVFANAQYSAEYLKIGNPLSGWTIDNYQEIPRIKSAEFLVAPKGTYSKVTLKMTISDEGTVFEGTGDTLEIAMKFKMPDGTEVIDMNLWIGDTIMPGLFLDNNVANAVYEDIVDRRTDPSILEETAEDEYLLQVYPCSSPHPRTVDMTFLIPNQVKSNGEMAVELPLNILELSNQAVQDIQLNFVDNNYSQSPSVSNNLLSGFSPYLHPVYGAVSRAKADPADLPRFFNYQPSNASLFFGEYADPFSGETFFQAYVKPDEIFQVSEKPRKVMFLIDYSTDEGSLSSGDMFTTVKQVVTNSLSATDSFNVVFSLGNTLGSQSGWIPAGQGPVNSTFANLVQPVLGNSNDLLATFDNALTFINNNGGKADVLVISNDYQAGYNTTSANIFTSTVSNKIGNPNNITLNFIDLYQGGQHYYQPKGNKDLYTNLSHSYNGFYKNVDDAATDIELTAGKYVASFKQNFKHLTLDVQPAVGFTVEQFKVHSNGLRKNLFDKLTGVTGYYVGAGGTIQLDVSAQEYNGTIHDTTFNITSSGRYNTDLSSRSIWTAYKLNSLSAQAANSPAVQQQIIDLSIENRVLHSYTAILCLEPGMEDEYGLSYDDGGGGSGVDFVGTGEKENPETTDVDAFTLYPNPARDVVHLSVKVEHGTSLQLIVSDQLGRVVKERSNIPVSAATREITLDVSELDPGIYFVSVRSEDGKFEPVKLIVE